MAVKCAHLNTANHADVERLLTGGEFEHFNFSFGSTAATGL